jgi:hypothetical protein
MTRPKGSKNNKPIVFDALVTTLNETILPELQESKSDQSIRECLLLIVDALYDKDGDAATWKPIRDKIEAL